MAVGVQAGGASLPGAGEVLMTAVLRAVAGHVVCGVDDVTALLAKIQLRFSGIECPFDSDALTVLLDAKRQNTNRVVAARTERSATKALAAMVLKSWLDTLPGTAR